MACKKNKTTSTVSSSTISRGREAGTILKLFISIILKPNYVYIYTVQLSIFIVIN